MGLIASITQLWRQWRKIDQGKTTTAQEMPQPRKDPMGAMGALNADRERTEIIKTCRRMYDEDPRADGVLHTLARDLVGAGFTVTTGNPKADKAAEELIARLDLVSRLDDWIRLSARDGDTFLEISVDDAKNIVVVSRKPTLEMHRASNAYDRFDDPTRAFWWSNQPWVSLEPPRDALWFAEWQIVHARWSHDEGQRYGRSLFKSATGPWKRIIEGEKDVATRRKTRAGMKYVHLFPPGTTAPQIEEYKQVNADILAEPLAAIQDFFGTAEIKTIEGDARLGEIADILHHIRTWWVASPVPMSLVGYGQDLNRDVLQEQKDQYDEALEALRPWVVKELLYPLFELQWLLLGILPDSLNIEWQWKAKQVLKAADLRDIAEAGIRLRTLGLPEQAIWTLLQRFLPGIDWESIREMQGDAAEGTPAIAGDALASLMQRLGSSNGQQKENQDAQGYSA